MDRREKRKKIILDFLKSDIYVPMKEKELAIMFSVEPEDRPEFKSILMELIADNKISISKRGKYTISKRQLLVGTFISNAGGFGFVEVEGQEEDYFVSADNRNGAFHQDVVEISVLGRTSGKRVEAVIVNIVEHTLKEIVGTFQASKNYGFVVPDNQKIDCDIFIPKEKIGNALEGHKVIAAITNYGRVGKNPEGKIVSILGHITDPGVDILSIVKSYDIPSDFPEKVLNQANRVSEMITEADIEGREDLRNIKMVTIDGEDAKDLDDAVSLKKVNGMYELGVHIADVSNYVQAGSALDREAIKRGVSVYLTDRVIPMLPRRLSNGICSLNQGEDRLAMSCIMTINTKGETVDYRIVESVIHVDRRMNYSDVQKILEEHDEVLIEKYKEFVEMFEDMAELSSILQKKRKARGAIDFDTTECKIVLDENGKPIDILPHISTIATKLIESFMLAANETVAAHIYWQGLPFIYRIHEAPDSERMDKLSALIANFGLYLKGNKDELHPKEIQKMLEQISGRDEENLISRMTLRSMMQAKYSTECLGHFGLACKEYTHFTSPIRRYPDLQIHRILKDEIRGRLDSKKIEYYNSILENVASTSSKLERRANEAERETDKLKKTQYMEQFIGSTYEGVISGVTNYGLYVELDNTVEGLVHISKMNGDYYYYDEAHYELVGEATGKKYRLGQKVAIIVNSVDTVLKTIDFILA